MDMGSGPWGAYWLNIELSKAIVVLYGENMSMSMLWSMGNCCDCHICLCRTSTATGLNPLFCGYIGTALGWDFVCTDIWEARRYGLSCIGGVGGNCFWENGSANPTDRVGEAIESADVKPGSDSSLIDFLLRICGDPFSTRQRCCRTDRSSSKPSCLIGVSLVECSRSNLSRMSCVRGCPPFEFFKGLPGQFSPSCNLRYNSRRPATSCDCCCSNISTYLIKWLDLSLEN